MARLLGMWSLVGLAVLVIGCASYQGGKTAERSGFLRDYPAFQKGRGGVDQVWLKPGVDWKPYDRIMLDEVVFFMDHQSEYRGLSAQELKELSDAYYKAFFDAMADGYSFVSDPGPGVLRLRTAITGLEKSNPVANTFSTVIPIGIGVNLISKGATGENVSVGNVTAEAELLDAITGERLGAVVDFRPGEKFEGFSGLGPAKSAFTFWARQLRSRLDELRGVDTGN